MWQPALFAGLALLVVASPNIGRLQGGNGTAPSTVQLQLPEMIGRWQANPPTVLQWTPNFSTATMRLARAYRGPAGEVAVHIDYYRGQRDDVKLVSSVNGFVSSESWHILSEGLASTTIEGRTVGWRRAVLGSSGGTAGGSGPRLTVWRLYWLGGRLAKGDVEAKLVQAWQAVLGEPDDGAAIHLVSALSDELAAEQQLAAFVSENFTMLERTLAAAKAGR